MRNWTIHFTEQIVTSNCEYLCFCKIISWTFLINFITFRSGDALIMFFGTAGIEYEYLFYPLYPHQFDDLIFVIFQRIDLKNGATRSSAQPIVQWLVFTMIAALILFVLREVVQRREQRLNRPIKDATAPDFLLGSFVDSIGVFLGVGLSKFGNCRAERWFLISFSVYGLIFKMIYTENLFVMFTAVNQNRITSIDQLFQANIPITVGTTVSNGDEEFYIRIGS